MGQATQGLKTIIEKIFGEEKVVGVRVLGKLDDLYVKALKLKTKREKYVYYKHQNSKTGETATITRGKVFCLRRGVTHDAVGYYAAKI